MQSDAEKLVKKNPSLNQLDYQKVVAHIQRDSKQDNWIIHSIMLEGYDVPFKFKRQGGYKSLKGARVNVTYYPVIESVAGLEFETMKVVRIKRS